MYVITIHQHYRRTDKQTDKTTYCSNTAYTGESSAHQVTQR